MREYLCTHRRHVVEYGSRKAFGDRRNEINNMIMDLASYNYVDNDEDPMVWGIMREGFEKFIRNIRELTKEDKEGYGFSPRADMNRVADMFQKLYEESDPTCDTVFLSWRRR